MFTGLIEEVGRLRNVSDNHGTKRIAVTVAHLTRELKPGDSVSVNGVCLTALDITPESFQADLAQETVSRTSLTRLALGSLVNLELPAKADSRLGGHVVQGHVDGIGTLISLKRVPHAEDWELTVELPAGLEKYVVSKGSIAIDGISLTVAGVEGSQVTIAVIPHTFRVTNLKSLKPGDPVNIEADALAKYAEKMLKGESQSGTITVERLIAEGF